MSEVASVTVQPSTHRRQTKFTPANIRQIVNLLDRGKTKDEIAEVIGVTPATLQVTCSKLGISLRRPTFHTASRISRSRLQNAMMPQNAMIPNHQELPQDAAPTEAHDEPTETTTASEPEEKSHTVVQLTSALPSAKRTDQNATTLTVRYAGRERTIDFPLDRGLLGQLALEAAFRSIDIGELISQVLLSVAQKDLFDSVLEGSPGRSKRHG